MKVFRKDLILRGVVYFCGIITISVLVFMLGYICIKGVPYLNSSLFSLKYTSENCSVIPALVNTILITLLALLVSVPLGVGSAIYLVEYAKKDNKFVKVVRMTTETLTGIPSIIYGLFGMLLFVGFFKWGYSILAGSFTVAIMILPTIMRTTEEALLAVPDSYREGSFGLGAGKLRTVFRIVLPSAVSGILSGIILAIGRVVNLHGGNSCADSGKCFRFWKNACNSHVCFEFRRTSHESGFCDCGCSFDNGCRN